MKKNRITTALGPGTEQLQASINKEKLKKAIKKPSSAEYTFSSSNISYKGVRVYSIQNRNEKEMNEYIQQKLTYFIEHSVRYNTFVATPVPKEKPTHYLVWAKE